MKNGKSVHQFSPSTTQTRVNAVGTEWYFNSRKWKSQN